MRCICGATLSALLINLIYSYYFKDAAGRVAFFIGSPADILQRKKTK